MESALLVVVGALLGFGSAFILKTYDDRGKAAAIRQQAATLLTDLQVHLNDYTYVSTSSNFEALSKSYSDLVFNVNAGLVFKNRLSLACKMVTYFQVLQSSAHRITKMKTGIEEEKSKIRAQTQLPGSLLEPFVVRIDEETTPIVERLEANQRTLAKVAAAAVDLVLESLGGRVKWTDIGVPMTPEVEEAFETLRDAQRSEIAKKRPVT